MAHYANEETLVHIFKDFIESWFWLIGWLVGFNVARATQWTITDGLGVIPKDDLETCHHNFDPPRRGWLPALVLPEV